MLGCVSWIPIEHQVGSSYRSKHLGGFCRSRRIASRLIFENQNHVFFRRFFGGVPQLFIHSRSIRPLIIQPPKIETPDAIRLKRLRQLDASFKHFILLLESKISVELIALGTVLRLRCARPIHLEKRAGDVRHTQLVLFQDAPRFFDFFCVQLEKVLVPHAAQLDPFHSKFLRGYFAYVPKVLTDLVVDHRNPEWRFHGWIHGCVTWDRAKSSCRRHLPEAAEKFTSRSVKRHTGSSVAAKWCR